MNEQQLLSAIAAAPDDSEQRLIFADWLEEHGDPRGELIRLLNQLTTGIEVAGRSAKEARLQHLTEVCDGPVTPFFTSTLGGEYLLILPGDLLMGSPDAEQDRDDEETQHRVKMTRPFYLGVHAVTQGKWKALMGDEPWKGKRFVKEGSSYPATYVSWDDAVKFCAELTKRELAAGRIRAGQSYRLPTEAEWEYACRAGATTRFSFGDDPTYTKLKEYAWFDGNTDDVDEQYAHAVGLKKPNAWGLYDLHGNVWEWCSDKYGDSPQGQVTDPQGASAGSYRVLRGGSWLNGAQGARSAYRLRGTPDFGRDNIGFRLALSPAGTSK